MPTLLPTLLRAILVWLLIMAGETAHGVLRRILFSPDVLFALRQVSVLIGVALVFAVAWFCTPWLRLRTHRAALSVGGLWVALTLAFEIAVGRLLGLGWDQIFAEYDLAHGGLMPMGLLAMGLTPWLVLRLRTPSRQPWKTP